MICPKCKKEMTTQKQGISHDDRNGKQYDRTVHLCKQDDVWVRVEIPSGV